MPNICILGLGNPEKKYDDTRHNIGKDWVLKLGQEIPLSFLAQKKIVSVTALSEDNKILWAYPQVYVNESGKCINKILKTSNLKLENILIIHDDLDLPMGTLRLKIDGGHGGHNGLRNIIDLAGSNFLRLRIGIGHPGEKIDVTNWVLGKFKPVEKKILLGTYLKFLNIIELLAENKIKEAQLYLHTN